jgi:hypothetical protein
MYKIGLDFYKISLKEQKIPDLKDELIYVIIRGIFDYNGDITHKTIFTNELTCSLNIYNKIDISVLNFINKFIFKDNITIKNNIFTLQDEKALYFLSSIYDNSDARFRSNSNYSQYLNWLGIKKIMEIKYILKDENAIIPKKNLDLNYDIYIINKIKNINSKLLLYDTGIIIQPECGYNIDIIIKNSLYDLGYILQPYHNTNDKTFKICLMKIDDMASDISLPACHFEIVLKKYIHYILLQ